MYHYGIVGFIYLLIPHSFKYIVCREYFSGIACKQIQNIKLNRRKLYFITVYYDLVVFLIDNFPIASGRHYPIFRPSEKGISGVFGKGAV